MPVKHLKTTIKSMVYFLFLNRNTTNIWGFCSLGFTSVVAQMMTPKQGRKVLAVKKHYIANTDCGCNIFSIGNKLYVRESISVD